MARDVRELILSQLFTELSAVPGLVAVYRNRGDLPPTNPDTGEDMLPAACLLDGKEKLAVVPKVYNSRQGPSINLLECQIFVSLKPAPNLTNEQVGQNLNTFRMAVLKQILNSASLMALVGTNGYVFYQGCETDLQTGSTIEGNMRIDLGLAYVFNPDNLN